MRKGCQIFENILVLQGKGGKFKLWFLLVFTQKGGKIAENNLGKVWHNFKIFCKNYLQRYHATLLNMSHVVCGKREKLTALQIFAWKCTNFHLKDYLEIYHRSVLNAICRQSDMFLQNVHKNRKKFSTIWELVKKEISQLIWYILFQIIKLLSYLSGLHRILYNH